MQYSVVRYSEIDESIRLDAEYYHPHNLSLLRSLTKVNHIKLGNKSYVTDGIHASIDFDESSNIKLISAKAPKENYFDTSNLKSISEEQNKKNPRTQLKLDDIILSTVGTIGNCAVVDNETLPANSDRHVGIIRVEKDLKPRFISTFLLGRYGRFQTLRESTGNVQLNLFIYKIKDLIIPRFSGNFENLIENSCLYAENLRRSSKSLYAEAENLLLEELSLKDWKPKHQLSYIKNYSDTQKAQRFDAEYFQPQYDAIIAKVKNIQNDDLGNIVKWSKGVEVGSEQYIDEGFDFIRISDFNTKGISEASKKISHDLFAELKDKFSPKKGDILFTKDGTIGLTYLVNQDQESIISSAFLKLRPKIDIESEYLALVLNCIICKKQIEMMSGGAIIAHLKPNDAMNLQIPILNLEKQQEISSKIIDSKIKDQQSKHLLSIAKKAVEMAIETSEDQATQYINQQSQYH